LLIKIINFQRKSPRRPADLRRLFGYLFTPQMAAEPDLNRLLGPPELNHLVLTHRPWGDELDHAADDLANQIDYYTREAGVCQRECAGQPGCKGLKACLGTKRPAGWYTHIVFSFAPLAAPDLRSPPDAHKTPRRNASPAANAIRISKDALDFMGWSETQPALFVVHGDKAHIHVHVVTTTPVFGGGAWDVFRFSRQQLFEIARICTDAFGLSTGTPMLRGYYRRWTRIHNAP
jgi:hypothetical protein